MAMYEAKALNRGHQVLFEPRMRRRPQERLVMEEACARRRTAERSRRICSRCID